MSENSQKVKAVGAGEVVYADSFDGMSRMVVIDHGKDYYTIYGKLKKIEVEAGNEIDPMKILGYVSSEGLYFELGRGAQPENPLEWLSSK